VPLLRELGQSVLTHVLPAQAQGHGTQATPNFVLRQLSDRGDQFCTTLDDAAAKRPSRLALHQVQQDIKTQQSLHQHFK
jgi:hypothetical protein